MKNCPVKSFYINSIYVNCSYLLKPFKTASGTLSNHHAFTAICSSPHVQTMNDAYTIQTKTAHDKTLHSQLNCMP